MLFYSGEDKNGFTVKLKSGFGWALQAGADYAIKDRWSANIDVKKVFYSTTATINGGALTSNVRMDPWVVPPASPTDTEWTRKTGVGRPPPGPASDPAAPSPPGGAASFP